MHSWLTKRQVHPALRGNDEVVDAQYFDTIERVSSLEANSIKKPATIVLRMSGRKRLIAQATNSHSSSVPTEDGLGDMGRYRKNAIGRESATSATLPTPHVLSLNS